MSSERCLLSTSVTSRRCSSVWSNLRLTLPSGVTVVATPTTSTTIYARPTRARWSSSCSAAGVGAPAVHTTASGGALLSLAGADFARL